MLAIFKSSSHTRNRGHLGSTKLWTVYDHSADAKVLVQFSPKNLILADNNNSNKQNIMKKKTALVCLVNLSWWQLSISNSRWLQKFVDKAGSKLLAIHASYCIRGNRIAGTFAKRSKKANKNLQSARLIWHIKLRQLVISPIQHFLLIHPC